MLKRMAVRVAISGKLCSYSIARLSRILLKVCPDQHDLMGIRTMIKESSLSREGNMFSVLKDLIYKAIEDEVLARCSCLVIPSVLTFFLEPNPWVIDFFRKSVGFIIIAQRRREYGTRVALLLQLFSSVVKSGVTWVETEISACAATLLASQMVPMMYVNGLKPALKFDSGELALWQSEEALKIQMETMLSEANIQVELILRPKIGAGSSKGSVRSQPVRPAPGKNGLITGRGRGAVKPVARPDRRLSQQRSVAWM